MLTLVLTRHGLTPRSDPEQHLGQKIDIELSPAGQAQAVALAVRLDHVRFERIYTSPLVRARETASIIAQRSPGTPAIEADPRLREMDYGHWEGLTYAQIEARDLAERQAWEADPARIPCPGGESGDDVAARVNSFLMDLLAAHDATPAADPATERPVLAVAHSSLNRILVCVALGIAVREFRLRLQQSQANLTAL
ncbi:MAG TPA: histidine phosphatase family protein, partial [Candidatus Limnocylindrales bacterium]|nr:histidine phosphatase family protein [Candidatus Limnocylindrales bacterium]